MLSQEKQYFQLSPYQYQLYRKALYPIKIESDSIFAVTFCDLIEILIKQIKQKRKKFVTSFICS